MLNIPGFLENDMCAKVQLDVFVSFYDFNPLFFFYQYFYSIILSVGKDVAIYFVYLNIFKPL